MDDTLNQLQGEAPNVIQIAFQNALQSLDGNDTEIKSHCFNNAYVNLPQSPPSIQSRPSCRYPGKGTFPQEPVNAPQGNVKEDRSCLPEVSPDVITQLDEFLDNFFIPSIEHAEKSSVSRNKMDLPSQQPIQCALNVQMEKFVTYIQWKNMTDTTTKPLSQIETSVQTTQNTQPQQCDLREPQSTDLFDKSYLLLTKEDDQQESHQTPTQLYRENTEERHQIRSSNTQETQENLAPEQSKPEECENVSLCNYSEIDFQSLAQYLQSADDNVLGVDILAEYNPELLSELTDSPTATEAERKTPSDKTSYSLLSHPSSCEQSQERSISWSAMDESPNTSLDRRLASTPLSSGEQSSGYLSASDMDSSSYMSQMCSEPISPIQFNDLRPSTPLCQSYPTDTAFLQKNSLSYTVTTRSVGNDGGIGSKK